MRIVILTQRDPFYLPDNIDHLINKLPSHHKIVACVLFKASPYGKKMSFFKQTTNSIGIFGLRFFIYYGFLLVKKKIFQSKSVFSVLKENKIEIVELKKNVNHPVSIDLIKDYHPDLLISIAGNQIFKKELIELAPNGCLNLHTALLPKYRGLMPSFWVLKNNEKETGVSVFFVDEGIDSGPILVQKRIPIGNKTQQELIRESKQIGIDAVLEAINKVDLGNYDIIPNDESKKTYFSFPTKADVQVFRKLGKKFFL